MAFSFNLETKDHSNKFYASFSIFITKYKIFLALTTITIALLFLNSALSSLVFLSTASTSVYIYRLYKEISDISLKVEIDGFDIQDIVNDLERR